MLLNTKCILLKIILDELLTNCCRLVIKRESYFLSLPLSNRHTYHLNYSSGGAAVTADALQPGLSPQWSVQVSVGWLKKVKARNESYPTPL